MNKRHFPIEKVVPVTIQGLKFQAEVKVAYERRATTKAAVWAPGPEDFGMMDAPAWPSAGDEAAEAAWAAYNKVVVAIKREVLDQVVPNSRWSFSRTCGCSCGCSPGFNRKDEKGGEQYYITVLMEFELSAK